MKILCSLLFVFFFSGGIFLFERHYLHIHVYKANVYLRVSDSFVVYHVLANTEVMIIYIISLLN